MKDSSKDGGAAEADKRAVGLMMTSAAAAIKDGVVAEAGERAVGSMVTTESQGGVRAAKDGGSRGGYSSEDSAASAAATASRPHGMRSAAAMAKAAADEDYGNHASAAMRPQYIFWQQHHLWYDKMHQLGREDQKKPLTFFVAREVCTQRGVGALEGILLFFRRGYTKP